MNDPLYDNCNHIHCSDLISVLVILLYILCMFACCNKHEDEYVQSVVQVIEINNEDGMIQEDTVPVCIPVETQ